MGDLEELFWLIYSDIKGLLWALPPTLLPALSPTERVGFGLCIHISLPSVSFSPLHFNDTLLPPWEGKQLGLGLAQSDCDCNHEIERHLLLGRKAMTNLDSVLKSRDIALLTKIHIVKAMLFSVVMYSNESWTIKKAEQIACKLWCWRRCLRVPWTVRRSNQSILKGINPEYSLEGLMRKLKFQYFGHLMRRVDSLEKTLIWEKLKAKGKEGSGQWDG